MELNENPDRIISVSTSLDCSIEKAFSYFSDNVLLESWLAKKADVEMKEGAKYHLFWTPEDPDLTNNSTFGCRVLAVDAPNYFNIEWRGNADQKSFMNNVCPLTNVSVMFHRLSDSQTKVTLLHTGWRNEKEWEEARVWFVNSWTGAFKKLREVVSGDDHAIAESERDSLFCYYLRLTDKYQSSSAWTDDTFRIIDRHAEWLDDLGKQGILLFAGRTLFQPGDENLFGIAVIRANNLEEAKAILAADPAVLAGIQSPKVFPYSMGIRHFGNL